MTHRYSYSFFGLNVGSDLELPGIPVSSEATPDLTITEKNVPDNLFEEPDQEITPSNLLYKNNTFLFRGKDSAKFQLKNNNEIIFERYKHATDDDVRVLLLSVVFGITLHVNNKFALHASAIEYEGKTLLFSGRSGAGKSTLAAAFIQRGGKLISDDISVIETSGNNCVVYPSYTCLKLWPDSLEALGHSPEEYKKLRPKIEKRGMNLQNVQKEATTIDAIIFLVKNINFTSDMVIQEINTPRKIALLQKHTYRLMYLKKVGNSQQHFETCCNLTKNLQMQKLTRPRGPKPSLKKGINLAVDMIHEKYYT